MGDEIDGLDGEMNDEKEDVDDRDDNYRKG